MIANSAATTANASRTRGSRGRRLLSLFQSGSESRLAYPLLAAAALGYSLVALELSLAGAVPMPEPFLRIADENYFFWGIFFYAPVIVAAWLLAGGAVYLMARAAGGAPSFDRLLKTLAFGTGIGTLATLIPDLVTSPLRAVGVISESAWEGSIAAGQGFWFVFTWVTLIAYVLLFAIVYPVAVKQVCRLEWRAAIGIGLAAFALLQGFEYIFIR